jgi:hypothetical protein
MSSSSYLSPSLTGVPDAVLGVLQQPDEVAVRVLDVGFHFGARVDQRLQGALDVIDVVVNHGSALVAMRIKADVGAVDLEADVGRLINDGPAFRAALNMALAFARSVAG